MTLLGPFGQKTAGPENHFPSPGHRARSHQECPSSAQDIFTLQPDPLSIATPTPASLNTRKVSIATHTSKIPHRDYLIQLDERGLSQALVNSLYLIPR